LFETTTWMLQLVHRGKEYRLNVLFCIHPEICGSLQPDCVIEKGTEEIEERKDKGERDREGEREGGSEGEREREGKREWRKGKHWSEGREK